MSHTPGSDNGFGSAGNGNGFAQRREARAVNITGMLPSVNTGRGPGSGTSELEQLIAALHELFERDRQTASQSDSTRCGICYLHFHAGELLYRDEEGYYVCAGCERALGKNRVPMVRRQQKME